MHYTTIIYCQRRTIFLQPGAFGAHPLGNRPVSARWLIFVINIRRGADVCIVHPGDMHCTTIIHGQRRLVTIMVGTFGAHHLGNRPIPSSWFIFIENIKIATAATIIRPVLPCDMHRTQFIHRQRRIPTITAFGAHHLSNRPIPSSWFIFI